MATIERLTPRLVSANSTRGDALGEGLEAELDTIVMDERSRRTSPQHALTTDRRRQSDEIVVLPPQQRESSDAEEEIDLAEYLTVFFKHKWSVFAWALLIPLIAGIVLLTTQSVYRSTTTLLIEPENVNLGDIEDFFSNPSSRAYYETQFEIMKSRGIAETVVDQLDLVNHRDFNAQLAVEQDKSVIRNWFRGWSDRLAWPNWLQLPEWAKLPDWISQELWPEQLGDSNAIEDGAPTTASAIGAFRSRLTIAPVNNSQLVEVSFDSTDPELAAAVANQVSEAYIESDTENRRRAEKTASEKLNERLRELRRGLLASEAELQSFRETEKLLDVEGVRTLVATRLASLTQSLLDAEKNVSASDAIYDQVKAFKSGSRGGDVGLPQGIKDDPILQGLLQEEAQVLKSLTELRSRYNPEHPDISAAEIELGGARSIINSRIRTLVGQMRQESELAASSYAALIQALESAKVEMREINRKEFQLAELQREVDGDRRLYETFVNRIKETDATSGIQPPNARIVDFAVAEKGAFKPDRKKLMLIALAAGLFIGLGWALLREYFDKTIKRVEDIEDRLQVPVLGFVPRLKKRFLRTKKSDPTLYYYNNPKSVFAEAIRSIRTNVLLSSVDLRRKIIVVTSPRPEDGKSTVSTNLAFALAENSKVLLIDADMRRPSIAKALGIDKSANGLSQYAADLCSLRECVYTMEEKNVKSKVSVIPSGIIPPNPLDLLSSRRFKSLLGSLIKEYQYIIIDSPPLLMVSDSLVLSTYASGVVLVTRAESTPHKLAQDAVKRLRSIRAPLIGAVLNDLNPKHQAGYEAYGYASAD